MDVAPRFLKLSDVAEILNTSERQVYQLVKRGELLGIQIGGRGQWRVERSALEAYIELRYKDARRQAEEQPAMAERPPDGEID